MFYQILSLITTIILLITSCALLWTLRLLNKRQAMFYQDMAERQERRQSIGAKRAELRKHVDALMAKNGKHDE